MLLKVQPPPAAKPLLAGSASQAYRAGGAPNTRTRVLDLYLEGWAEVNASKIFAAIVPGYRFKDPLVGAFSRWTLPLYFEQLRLRFADSGPIATRDLAFLMRGPADGG